MVKIDLLNESAIGVYINPNPSTVARVGEIVVLTNDPVNAFEPRPPWKYFTVATDWRFDTGAFVNNLYKLDMGEHNVLVLSVTDCTIDEISKLYDAKECTLALLQAGDGIPLQAAVCQESSLCGVRIIRGETKLAFDLNDCQMVYNR